MTTLNDIISLIDKRILHEEQTTAAASSASKALIPQERMIKYVLVRTGEELLAIPIEGLSEIGPMPAVTQLPNLPTWIKGIANRRGEIISIIQLELLLNKYTANFSTGDRLAVLNNGTMKIGICIDQVIATVSRPESDHVINHDSSFKQAEPDVFEQGLHIDNVFYQVLQPKAFLDMDRLQLYYSHI
jgi:chemotaxis signal transduction protein